VILYTCESGKSHGNLPGPLAHPCAKAAAALDSAGHSYEWKKVKGALIKPWTLPTRSRDRAEIEQLSKQRSVPILVLDSGEVITGSAAIVRWADDNKPTPQAASTEM
jgi:glutathione S-transferase